MNPGFELRHLRYFVAVAEELHFGRAAKRLGIAQPPLSQQIQRLEQHIGVSLLDRRNRRTSLTAAGERFLTDALEILASVQQAAAGARRAAEGETGSLTVSYAASVMFLALPRIIRRFRARFPDVHLELRELPTGPQLAALRTGDLDVGFLREPPPDPNLMFEAVMREPLMIAISRRHRLAGKARLTVRDLADEDFVLFPQDLAPGLHAQVQRICAEAGYAPRVRQLSRELYTTVSLVEAGMGVTIVPASLRKLGWRGVRYVRIGSDLAMTTIAAGWRPENQSPALLAFLDGVRGVRSARRT